jgi:hypothetical protein
MALSSLLIHFVVLLDSIAEENYHNILTGRQFSLEQYLLPYHSVLVCPL